MKTITKTAYICSDDLAQFREKIHYVKPEISFDKTNHFSIEIQISWSDGQHKQLNYENYCKDSQREYGFQSQCRECKRVPSKEYNRRKRNESRSKTR